MRFTWLAPIALLAAPAQSQEQPNRVQYVDATRESLAGARGFAAAASRDKIAIVVWGGNRTLQQEAYNAALDLVDAGIPAAFILAPDGNGLDGDANFMVYACSLPYSVAAYGTNWAHEVRAAMRSSALEAHRSRIMQGCG